MFRSSSGPSLSINTTSANAIGGTSSLPPAAGNSGTKPLFGSSATTSQPQQVSSVFGAPQSQTTAGQQTGSLFGNLGNQNTGGPFGSQQNQKPPGGLFGSDNAQQLQPQQGGGLFGSMAGQPQGQTQAQQGSNLFGTASNNQNSNSLFSTAHHPVQAQQSTIQSRAPLSIFSNSIGQQSQQQQTVPGVRISVNELRPTTRFNDLHEELQKTIEYVDAFIVNKIQWQEQCDAANNALEEMCQQIPPDVKHCTRNLDVVQQALENDAESIAFAKNLVKADAADAKLNFKAINNLKLPQQFHQTNIWNSVSEPQHAGMSFPDVSSEDGGSRNLVDFFSKQADEMSKTLESYKRSVGEVEVYLKGVESSALRQMQHLTFSRSRDGGVKSAEDQVRELAAVLRVFEDGILGVATKLGGARENVQDAILGSIGNKNRSLARRS